MIGFYAAGAMGGGGPPAATLYDEIIARSPVLYWRHAEAAGTTMEEEGGNDGSYTVSGMPGQTAIYSGGPTCITTASGGGQYAGTIPALNELSVVTFSKGMGLGGFRGIVSNDDASNRHWQFRANGTDLEFVKINIPGGSVVTVPASGALNPAVTKMLGVSVSAGGVINLYTDAGLLATSSATGAFNYGGSGTIQVGFMTGGGGALANAFFSESAIFNTELSGTDFAAFKTAAGL